MEPVRVIVILFFSAFTGWFISWLSIWLLFAQSHKKKPFFFIAGGFTPVWKAKIGDNMGKLFQKEFEETSFIEDKVSDPSLFEKLKPEIEKHVDFFLNEKLATVFPLLYKFMGEKTLLQFKQAFMIEIDLLFPVIIKQYVSSLKAEIKIDSIIAEKINAIPIKKLKEVFLQNAKKEIFYFKLSCSIIGLFMGLLTVIVLSFI